MSAYRSQPPAELPCPRCKKKNLPALDVTTCACGGVWVSAFAASEVLTAVDRKPDPVTRWWKVREPCPACGEQMLLFGNDPGLLQGCAVHGYFVDGDTVAHTGLARGVDLEALERKRQDPQRVEAEREEGERVANRMAAARENSVRRERALDSELERRADVERLTTDDYAFAEALRAQLGNNLADAMVARLQKLHDLLEQVARRR
jgi:hypothetical protein